MNRYSDAHFATNPTSLDIKRSKFKRPFEHKTTFNAGDLIPIYIDEVLPGDSVSRMQENLIIRMSTPIAPIMDNLYLDTYYFFVPTRLTWKHWQEFWGENNTNYWEQETEYTIPQITAPEGGWEAGTLADYFGIPTKVPNISVSHLPFRAYCLIWNEWFRDQNTMDPCLINMDETTTPGSNSGAYQNNAQAGALPLKVSKYHDYFTASLPQPQRGPDVMIPLVGGNIPVVALPQQHDQGGDAALYMNQISTKQPAPNNNMLIAQANTGAVISGGGYDATAVGQYPTNLWAQMNNVENSTINQLRQAFAVQKMYEKMARGGTRYIEFIKSFFGVNSPDSRLQRPELLGGSHIPISINQVIQTSSTDSTSPQGNTAAYSMTGSSSLAFNHSFVEHGYIIGVACVRTRHTYQQGIERFWNRKEKTDFYLPTFANIGEQPILNKEIFAQGNEDDEKAFGYQEAWADYRYKPNRVSGAFRSNYNTTLDYWHFADDYETLPTLSAEWMQETKVNVDRTLAVTSALEHQFLMDMQFDATWIRPMPVYSIPGLIDHN